MNKTITEIKNNISQNIKTAGNSVFADPLTFKKALLLCFYSIGLQYAAGFIAYIAKINIGFVPDLLFLAIVLFIAKEMGKNELRQILKWRSIPIPVFAGVMVLFFGFNILRSEFSILFQILLPVPDGFFDSLFYKPENIFMVVLLYFLSGFSEEIFFRGILARKFFRSYSPFKAILFSALLFGVMHVNPWQSLNSFLGGIFYSWVYWRYRSIWLCIFTHVYSNLLVSLMPLPYTGVSSGYGFIYRHPPWFLALGAVLFVIGLLMIILFSVKIKRIKEQ